MARGDVGLIAGIVGVSNSTIYNIAKKIGLDLSPKSERCKATVDFISNKIGEDEHKEWLQDAARKIAEWRAVNKPGRKKKSEACEK